MMASVYLDYAATTPLDERVYQKMVPYFTQKFGNPSSIHVKGQDAEAAIESARSVVAECLGCDSNEIIFTGGGTESDNLALRGVSMERKINAGADHILISPVEHHAVLKTAEQLGKYYGFELEFLPVNGLGMVSPDDVKAKMRKNTAMVSVIYGNNEIGTINPVTEIGELCRKYSVPFHTDAVQAAAHVNINVENEFIDLLSIGAHKFYGPKGVGALYIKNGISVIPVNTGGSQENGLRAGTQNVPYIVGLAEALKITKQELEEHVKTFTEMRDYLIKFVLDNIEDARLTGHPTNRLANHASFVFKNADGNQLSMILDANGFSCSSGSACKSGNPKPSGVLLNMGFSEEWALGSLRVTFGRHTTMDQVIQFSQILPKAVKAAR